MEKRTKISRKAMDGCWIFLARPYQYHSVTFKMDVPLVAYVEKENEDAVLSITEETLKTMMKAMKLVNHLFPA